MRKIFSERTKWSILILPVLAVRFIDVTLTGPTVSITGELSGARGETLLMWRYDADLPGDPGEQLPLRVGRYGSRTEFSVIDEPGHGRYRYRLVAVTGGENKVLWERDVRIGNMVPGLALLSVSPNPSRDAFQFELSSESVERPDGSIKSAQAPVVDMATCTGCGICVNKCPVVDAPAIYVTSVGETRSERNQVLLDIFQTEQDPY